ncbi:unnamed protein product [Vicia faba]|uniref:Uncharacterized protein n=1 Tax=Vicia faba TaxID=3906 RepID=A0AAV1ANQ6_VICFA|nr:unnamed protein product [Vicia faba]
MLLPMFVFATPMLKFIGQPVEVAEQAGLVAIWLILFHLSFPFQFTLQRFLQCQLKTAILAWVLERVILVFDARTSYMKPNLHVTINCDAVEFDYVDAIAENLVVSIDIIRRITNMINIK